MTSTIKHSLNKHESDIPKPTDGDFVSEFISRRTSWLNELTGEKQSDFFDQALDDELVTLLAIYDLTPQQWNEKQQKTIFTLEKRFVVRGYVVKERRLTNLPESHFEQQCEFWACIYLSSALLKLASDNDLNALNSSIRLIDHAYLLFLTIDKLSRTEVIKNTVALELLTVKQVMEQANAL